MLNHEDMVARVEEFENSKPNTLLVFSYNIAKRLVVEYGFFNALIGVHKNKKDETGKLHVWHFKKYDSIEEVFNKLVQEAIDKRACNG